MNVALPALTPEVKEGIDSFYGPVVAKNWDDPVAKALVTLLFFSLPVSAFSLAIPVLVYKAGHITMGAAILIGLVLVGTSMTYGLTAPFRVDKKLWGKDERVRVTAKLSRPAKFINNPDGTSAVEVSFKLDGRKHKMRFDHFVVMRKAGVNAVQYHIAPESKVVKNGEFIVSAHTRTGQPLTMGPNQETIVGPAIIYVR